MTPTSTKSEALHNDPHIIITFESPEDRPNEAWTATPDTRHGQRGYRVCRYIHHRWDSYYMFFTSLDNIYTAFKSGKLENGRRAF